MMDVTGGDGGVADPGREAWRPRLLFLCQTLPYPPDSGVHNRSYNVLRQLARGFDVTAGCFYRRASRNTPEAVRTGLDGMRRIGPTEAFPIPQEHSTARLLFDHLRSLVTRTVYTRFVHESEAFSTWLDHELSRADFDIVHVDSLDLSGYITRLEGLPVACTHHNCEHELLARRAAAERNPLKRAYLALQSRLSEEEAREWCPRVALNVTVSERDRDALEAVAPGSEFLVVENGVDTSYFTPGDAARHEGASNAPPRLVFVGSHGWYPNRDAMEFFGHEILPRVREALGEVDVTWVGRASPDVRTRFERRHGIHLTGYVDDVRPYVRSATCYVAPLRLGGGTRLKILDAWAMGAAVVSTRIGCEGLHTLPGENIAIAEDADAFVDAVVTLVRDRGLRERIGRGGRDTAVRRYEWEVLGYRMLERYLDIATDSGPSA